MTKKFNTVLIFDSGVGGLSILEDIKTLPNIKYIYILDNEAFPYGNKTKCFIIQRSIKIIKTIKKNYPISITIIACNTASTVALSILRKTFNFPIIGIFPDIKHAEKISQNKIIGLIATQATINSSYIKKRTNKKNPNKNIQIISTNKLAVIAEKKIRGLIISKIELKKIFQKWIDLTIQPDTIILGCTHFLLLKKEIKEILYKSIYFVDSKDKIIQNVKKHFNRFNIDQKIKDNIFLYSKNNIELKKLLFFLKKYNFKEINYLKLISS